MPADETTPLLPSADQDTTQPTDTMSASILWKTGAIFGATAVGLGAFGAHGLKARISDPQKLANWSTAAQYQVRVISSPGLDNNRMRTDVLSPPAHPLCRSAGRQQQPRRGHALHSGHDPLQRQPLRPDARRGAVPVPRAGDAAGRAVSHRRLAGAGVWEARCGPALAAAAALSLPIVTKSARRVYLLLRLIRVGTYAC